MKIQDIILNHCEEIDHLQFFNKSELPEIVNEIKRLVAESVNLEVENRHGAEDAIEFIFNYL